jgi:hypothetical protein
MNFAQVKGKNVVITLPVDVLVNAFNYNPNNYDEAIRVKYKRRFAQGFVNYVNEISQDSESGLTVFQEWVDTIFDAMIENSEPYINFPEDNN